MTFQDKIANELFQAEPGYYEFLTGVSRGLKAADLDFLMLFNGMEGAGKSNLIKYTAYPLASLLGKKISIQKNWFFSAEEFMEGLQKPATDFLDAAGITQADLEEKGLRNLVKQIDYAGIQKFKKKWRHSFFILDEAQDLFSHDVLKTFSKQLTRVLMGIRDFNFIILLAFPDLTLLNRYIRAFRVKCLGYSFLTDDGFMSAVYGRSKYVNIVTAPPLQVQSKTLKGEAFIKAWAADLHLQNLPRFPRNNAEWRKYIKLKRAHETRLILRNTMSSVGLVNSRTAGLY